jgi:competence protein ComEA
LITKFLDKLKSYLEISNFERRGIIALLFILVAVIAYIGFSKSDVAPTQKINRDKLAKLQAEIAANLGSKKYGDENNSWKNPTNPAYDKSSKTVVEFDPNVDDFKTLLSKGVPYKAVQNIVNFRNKGGRFRSAEDLKKLYNITPEIYAIIAPYASFTAENTLGSIGYKPKDISNINEIKLSLNTASAADLESLRGIGPTFAKRIVKYRQSLGGFHTAEQLFEVWGLDSALVQQLVPNLIVDRNAMTLVKLNSATKEELSAHPYISYKEANAIVSYRAQHGSFTQISSLQKLHIFAGKDIGRLIPYLDLN